MTRRGRLVTLAGWTVVLLIASQARGEMAWHEHYIRGLELESQAAWNQALLEFQAAAKVAPTPQKHIQAMPGKGIAEYDPQYHIALCLTEMGRPRIAAGHLKISWNARVTPLPKLQALRKRIQDEVAERSQAKSIPTTPIGAPEAAPGRLSVQSDPPGATVLLDGAEVGTTPLGPITVTPGAHVVRTEAAGYRPVEESFTVGPGATSTLVVPLAANPSPTPARGPRPHATRPAGNAIPAPTAAVAAPPSHPPTTATSAPLPPKATPRRQAGSKPSSEKRPLPLAALGLAAVAVVAGAGAWLVRRRRRVVVPTAPTGPTMVYEEGATVVETGAKMGSYDLHSVLGRGGMATTYRAKRESDGQTVAVKVPHEGCLSDKTFVARFLREGKLGEQLHHPRIVRIFAAGEDKGRPFLAMELITGHTLKQEMKEHAPLPLHRALEITRDIAEALDYAHAKGVVHRDLKPENVMLLPDGTIKVMDFGIARLTDQPGLTTSNLFLGTPLYAAPEMIDPKSIDHRVDLYALGIILYEMLEGGVPFTADSPFRVLEMHMRQPLPAREQLAHPVPAPVWAIIQKLCEKDPAARYPNAEPLLVELNRLLQNFAELEGGDVS